MAVLGESDIPRRLGESFGRAADSPITLVVWALVLVLVLIGLVLLVRGRLTASRLRSLARTRRTVDDYQRQLELLHLDGTASAVREFREHLLAKGKRRHRSARHYLTDEKLQSDIRVAHVPVLRQLTWRMLDDLPSWAIGVGILGTFIGVSYALGVLDPNAISQSVSQTISGLATAFWASVSAVFASLGIQFLSRHVEVAIDDALAELVRAIDAQIDPAAADDMVRSTRKLVRDMTEAVKDRIAQSTAVSEKHAREFTQAAIDRIAGALDQHFGTLGTAVRDFGTQITAMASRMEQAVTSTAQIVTEQRALLAANTEAARHIGEHQREALQGLTMIPGLMSQITTISEANTRGLAEQQRINGEMAAVLRQTSDAYQTSGTSLSVATQTLVPVVTDLAARMSGLVGQIDAATAAHSQATANVQVVVGDSQRLVDGLSGASQHIIAVSDRLRVTVDSLGTTAHSLESTSIGMQAGAQQLGVVSTALDGVSRGTVDWARASTDALEDFQVRVVEALRSSLVTYDRALVDTLQRFQTLVDALDARR